MLALEVNSAAVEEKMFLSPKDVTTQIFVCGCPNTLLLGYKCNSYNGEEDLGVSNMLVVFEALRMGENTEWESGIRENKLRTTIWTI